MIIESIKMYAELLTDIDKMSEEKLRKMLKHFDETDILIERAQIVLNTQRRTILETLTKRRST